jgi:acyl-CoA reductase-like NAD-dependent aldehyde dehydrogenase
VATPTVGANVMPDDPAKEFDAAVKRANELLDAIEAAKREAAKTEAEDRADILWRVGVGH